MQLAYNQKLVGEHGELYKYGEAQVGVYTTSKRMAKRLASVPDAIKRQDGDYETTFSFPESRFAMLLQILRIKPTACWQRD